VPRQLQLRAESWPNIVATELLGDSAITYRVWEDRSNAAARGMLERGLRRGSRVLLPCDAGDWLDYAVAYVATQKIGAVTVPVSSHVGQPHIARVLREAAAVAAVGAKRSPAFGAGVMSSTVAELEADQPAEPLEQVVEPGDVAEILYTSGTTGTPKGVAASHENLLYTHALAAPAGQGRRIVLHSLPPATTAGQGLLLQPLDAIPHTVLTLADYDDRSFLAAVHERRPTHVVLVPALALSLIRVEDIDAYDLTSVEVVRTTSASIAPAGLQRLDALFPRASVINMYASTESWPARTRIRFDPSRPRSVGRPAGGSSLRIADAEGGELPAGEVGEVQLRLEGAARRSYDGDPAATARVFVPGGWVRMGDTGYVDQDGYLYLVDRQADLINSGGRNISSLEIEAALQEHPAVIEAAAFGIPHAILGEYPAAAVRLDEHVSPSELLAFAKDRLGSQLTPRHIAVVEKFPRNIVGKVLKRALRDELAVHWRESRVAAQPASELEIAVARMWERSLDVEGLDLEDDFLALGGNPLAAMEVAEAVRRDVGVDISQRDVFDASTLGDFVRRVQQARPARAESGSPPGLSPSPDRTRDDPLGPPSAKRSLPSGGLLAWNRSVGRNRGRWSQRTRTQDARSSPATDDDFTSPASYMQEQFFDAATESLSNQNLLVALRFTGPLDHEVIREALRVLAEKHEPLRTVLRREDGVLNQVVSAEPRLELVERNLTSTTNTMREVRRVASDDLVRPFDLTQDFARATLMRLDAQDHALVLTLHHAIADAWSLMVLARELRRAYRVAASTREPALPALPMSFADYAAWERGEHPGSAEAYWKRALGRAGGRVGAMRTSWRPEEGGTMAAHVLSAVPAEAAAALSCLAAEEETTLTTALLAVIAGLMSPYTRDGVSVGLMSANRERSELQPLVGCVADMVPLRVDVGPDMSFRELLRRTRDARAGAARHRMPYGAIHEKLRGTRNWLRDSLVDVALNYFPRAHEQRPALKLPGQNLRVSELLVPFHHEPKLVDRYQIGPCVLGYNVHRDPQGRLRGHFIANAEAVPGSVVQHLAPGFADAIERVVERPDAPVGGLPVPLRSSRRPSMSDRR
jgi:acyl-CoA synthetase (AMP-forming)/AMP-acid ligase II